MQGRRHIVKPRYLFGSIDDDARAFRSMVFGLAFETVDLLFFVNVVDFAANANTVIDDLHVGGADRFARVNVVELSAFANAVFDDV